METRVLIRSHPNPQAAFPLSQWYFCENLIVIGPLVSEIFMFESVDTHTHTHTHSDGQTQVRLVYYKLTLLAFGSGELKTSCTEIHPLCRHIFSGRCGHENVSKTNYSLPLIHEDKLSVINCIWMKCIWLLWLFHLCVWNFIVCINLLFVTFRSMWQSFHHDCLPLKNSRISAQHMLAYRIPIVSRPSLSSVARLHVQTWTHQKYL